LNVGSRAGQPGKRGGKAAKTIKGTRDQFERLRVGDHRVMFDLLHEDRVVLVLGIVNRRDLETWLRRR
jgi:mRNA-degrading endonuclease RelE of RelBE toxin-antitoxin system